MHVASPPRATSPGRLARTLLEAAALAAAMLVAGAISVFVLGQDANWDLQNYHFYNAWAFLHGRLGWDLAPAQLQSFHNPLLDLPFYAMVAADWPPRWISLAMALPAGVGAFFLGKIVLLLFAGARPIERWLYSALAFAVGLTAVGPVSMLGSTINEWPGAMLVTIALWLVLRRAQAATIGWRLLVAAGFLCGMASGLKLTAATYALGLCAALLLRPPVSARGFREAVVFGLAVAGGLALSLGFWMWTLYARFGNPLFPYFNDVFRSPWWDPRPLLPRTYGPHTLRDWLTFPFRFFEIESGFVGELQFMDWRLPLLYLVFIAATAVWIVRGWRARVSSTARPSREAWRLLGMFWIVSFLAWTAIHSIYRYLLPLELLVGAMTIYLLQTTLPGFARLPAALAYAIVAISTTVYPDWWHVPYGEHYFRVDVPPVATNALVLLVTPAPMAYVLPFFPHDARFLGAYNNLNGPKRHDRLEREIATIVREHDGPIYSLAFPTGEGAEIIAAHNLGIAKRDRDCAPVKTNMSTSPLDLCRLQRIPAPAEVLR